METILGGIKYPPISYDEIFSYLTSPYLTLFTGYLLALLVFIGYRYIYKYIKYNNLYFSFNANFTNTTAYISNIFKYLYSTISNFMQNDALSLKSEISASENRENGEWYCNEVDIEFFKSRLGENAGPWRPFCSKSLDEHLKYNAYYRILPNNKTEYKSNMIVRDSSAEELADFWLDDAFRAKWDPMLSEAEIVERGEFEDRSLVIRWIRSFPFPFLTDREYVIARKIFRKSDAIYTISKSIAHPSIPITRALIRMDCFYSMWTCRDVECPWGSDRSACEVTLIHHEQFKIPEKLARFAATKGASSFVKSMDSGIQLFIEQRRKKYRKIQKDPKAYGYVEPCPSLTMSETSTDMESDNFESEKKKRILKTIRRALFASLVGTLVFVIKQKNK